MNEGAPCPGTEARSRPPTVVTAAETIHSRTRHSIPHEPLFSGSTCVHPMGGFVLQNNIRSSFPHDVRCPVTGHVHQFGRCMEPEKKVMMLLMACVSRDMRWT